MTVNYDDLLEDIQNHQADLNVYDIWMIGKVTEKYNQIQKYLEKYMLGEALQETIDMTWGDFCDWYIEISKKEASLYTPKVLLYVLGTLYKLLHPYLPFTTESLWEEVGFEGMLMVSQWPTPLQMQTKNYRINLLMDMIAKWRTLKGQLQQKSHEKVTLFVQANKDILDLVETHASLIKDIIYVDELLYYSNGQEVPGTYHTDMLMDIKIGIKGEDNQTIDWKEILHGLEKQASEEEGFLQRMRTIISSAEFLDKAPPHVVEERKVKMQEVKQKINQLHAEIQKLKSQHA